MACTRQVLRIARRKAECRVLGPGKRAVIWFYGCSRRCPGCIASAMNSSGIFEEETPEGLAAWVRSVPGIEGITISGGEPFEQDEEALRRFLQLVREDGRSPGVICFSGFTLEQIRGSEKADLLTCIDLLIDGPYVDGENDGRGLRGSRNQHLSFLTPRYRSMERFFLSPQARNLEIELDMNGKILINGIPDRNFLGEFTKKMQAAGYALSFNPKENCS